ncbi:MAG: putative AHL-lactonase [Comamonadaceae bacterium]|nr:MAG: putative AHL-lactonase [Comamonadaceae bacterium]
MTQVKKMWPLLTATHRYDKSISTLNRGRGQQIEAPILAYLIETANGRLGLTAADVDVIFIGHLHFDHAGGLKELRRCGCGAEIHVQSDEVTAARSGVDTSVFADELLDDAGAPLPFCLQHGEYSVLPGVQAVLTPGHTLGHMSMLIELPKGPPVLLAGDAADLQENLDDEIAPGTLWQGREAQALASIRKLKALARDTGAVIWPNHDMAFYRSLPPFPGACE